MKVYVKGQGREINLTQRDLVGQGGQGSVYAQGTTAFKVYHDPKDMLPEGKIQELAEIRDPYIIRPHDVLTTKAGVPVGYTTTFVHNAWVLCQLFPVSFRHREGLTPDQTQELVVQLRKRIESVHAAGVLVVDANEMNFLVDRKFANVYGIDVDSYQTAHYPAPAIMDSIRDWTAKRWSPLTDWYSFGILAFQMLVGIHPFKGRYHGSRTEYRAKLPTDADDDTFAITRRRMAANISVYHKDVSVPNMVLPLDSIPDLYRKWFKALFVRGERVLPPLSVPPVVVVVAPPTVPAAAVPQTTQLEALEIGKFDGTIIGVWTNGPTTLVATDRGLWLDGARVPVASTACCGWSPISGRAVAAYPGPRLYNVTDRVDIGQITCEAQELSCSNGRIYARTAGAVYEIVLNNMSKAIYPTLREVVQTLPHASRLYPGVVVQRLLGSTYVTMLTASGEARQTALAELDGYRVVDAAYDVGVLMVVGEQRGRFDRLVFRFADDGQHDVRIVAGISHSGLNFVVLDTGICVCLNEDGTLEVFAASSHASPKVRYVDDPILRGGRLWRRGGTLLLSRGSNLYSLRMKS